MIKLPKLRSKKRLGLLLGVAIIVAAAFIGFKMINSPAEGAIKNVLPAAAPNEPKTSYIEKQGTYITFSYPDKYEDNKAARPTNTDLEHFLLLGRQNGARLLAITVTQLPSGKLIDDSGYSFRLNHKETYVQSTTKLPNGQTAMIMANQTVNFEKTAFIMYGTKLASVALSSAGGQQDELQTEFDSIVSSVTWK